MEHRQTVPLGLVLAAGTSDLVNQVLIKGRTWGRMFVFRTVSAAIEVQINGLPALPFPLPAGSPMTFLPGSWSGVNAVERRAFPHTLLNTTCPRACPAASGHRLGHRRYVNIFDKRTIPGSLLDGRQPLWMKTTLTDVLPSRKAALNYTGSLPTDYPYRDKLKKWSETGKNILTVPTAWSWG